jgi:hypothetical protein
MRQQQEKFMFLVVPIVDILSQTGWTVRYDVVTGLWLRQTEQMRGDLWKVFRNV